MKYLALFALVVLISCNNGVKEQPYADFLNLNYGINVDSQREVKVSNSFTKTQRSENSNPENLADRISKSKTSPTIDLQDSFKRMAEQMQSEVDYMNTINDNDIAVEYVRVKTEGRVFFLTALGNGIPISHKEVTLKEF